VASFGEAALIDDYLQPVSSTTCMQTETALQQAYLLARWHFLLLTIYLRKPFAEQFKSLKI